MVVWWFGGLVTLGSFSSHLSDSYAQLYGSGSLWVDHFMH